MSMFDRCAAIYRSHSSVTELIGKALDLVITAEDSGDYFEIARLLIAAEHLYADELIERVQASPDIYAPFAQYVFSEHKPHLLSAAVFSGSSSARLARFVGPQKSAIEGAIELLSHTHPEAREASKMLLRLAPDGAFHWDPPRPEGFEPGSWQVWWEEKSELKGPHWEEPALLGSE